MREPNGGQGQRPVSLCWLGRPRCDSPRSGGPLREARRVRHGRRLVPSGQGDCQDRKVVVEDVGPLQLAAVLDQPVHDVLG